MTDTAAIPTDVVRTVPEGQVVYGMQLPIQSQSTLYVADWEKELLIERWKPLIDPDPYSNPSLKYGTPRLSSPIKWKWATRRFPRRRARRKATTT